MGIDASTVSNVGGAVNDLFSIGSYKTKAAGARLEAENYRLASDLALQNVGQAHENTSIKEYQTGRAAFLQLGGQQADVAGAGFGASGSALDLFADSARQAALTHATLQQQGLIAEAGYKQQFNSYQTMASAAEMAAAAEEKAGKNAFWTSAIKLGAAAAGGMMGGPAGAQAGATLGGWAATTIEGE